MDALIARVCRRHPERDLCKTQKQARAVRIVPLGTPESSPAIYCRVGPPECRVPEGRLNPSPVKGDFKRPSGTRIRHAYDPAMNCRATLNGPAGTCRLRCCANPGLNDHNLVGVAAKIQLKVNGA